MANEQNCVRVARDLPLELLAPLGCGIQTGAGAVLNTLTPEAGSSIAIFGTGSVGLAALLGAVVAGCGTIIAVDIQTARLATATELGATHTINSAEEDVVERIREITGGAWGRSRSTASAWPTSSAAPSNVCSRRASAPPSDSRASRTRSASTRDTCCSAAA